MWMNNNLIFQSTEGFGKLRMSNNKSKWPRGIDEPYIDYYDGSEGIYEE